MISRFRNITQTNIKLNNNKQQSKHSKEQNPNFKGFVDTAIQTGVQAGTQALNYLNTSPAVGACFIDFLAMVLPRTAVDMTRSLDAGVETGIRESSGTVNHALAGVVGLGAGYLVSAAFNKEHGIKSHLMFMDSKAIDTYKNFVNNNTQPTGYDIKGYWNEFFKSLQGMNTSKAGNWHSLSDEAVTKATEIMTNANKKTYAVPKEALAKINDLIIGETGAGSTYRIMKTQKAEKVITQTLEETGVNGSLKELLSSANSMLKAVTDKAAHDKTPIVNDLEKLLSGVKNKKVATVAAGLAIPVAAGIAVQPVNRYLTKKRTGTDGFVGVEGREQDKSIKFKLLKSSLAFIMGSAMIASILKKPSELFTNFGKASKELLSSLQFKGMVPTIDQFKFIYGLTIVSRVLSARDKNEARECAIKDSLGFANWLILGGFVSKLAAKCFKKGIVNYNEELHGKGTWNYIQHAVEKTHEEILYPTLKKLGISSIGADGKVLNFRKLLKLMNEKAKSPETAESLKNLVKETNTKLKYKNYAQLLGYIYSGVVLGVGIPKLNIAITKRCEKKAQAKKALESNDKMKLATVTQLKPESKTFSAFGAYLN